MPGDRLLVQVPDDGAPVEVVAVPGLDNIYAWPFYSGGLFYTCPRCWALIPGVFMYGIDPRQEHASWHRRRGDA